MPGDARTPCAWCGVRGRFCGKRQPEGQNPVAGTAAGNHTGKQLEPGVAKQAGENVKQLSSV